MSIIKIKWIILTVAGVVLGVVIYLLERFVF